MSTKFKQHFFLAIDEESRNAYLLGYPLRLTHAEFTIISLIFDFNGNQKTFHFGVELQMEMKR